MSFYIGQMIHFRQNLLFSKHFLLPTISAANSLTTMVTGSDSDILGDILKEKVRCIRNLENMNEKKDMLKWSCSKCY